MTDAIANIRQAYDLATDTYADKFLDELLHKPIDVQLLSRFASAVGRERRVLDIGCGPGHTTAHLASLGLTPVGVDLSPRMVAKANRLFPKVDFVVGDFSQLSDPDDSVLGILAFYCFVHLRPDELASAFKEMFRVLKPGGILLLSFHIGSDPIQVDDFLDTGGSLKFFTFPVEVVRSALLAAGFEKIDVHERPPYDIEYPTNRCYIFANKEIPA